MRPGADKKLKTSSSLKFDIESNSYAKEYKISLVTQSLYAKNYLHMNHEKWWNPFELHILICNRDEGSKIRPMYEVL